MISPLKTLLFAIPQGQQPGQVFILFVAGDRAAFYNVRILGIRYLVHKGRQALLPGYSYIEGTVDYIFGLGQRLSLKAVKSKALVMAL